MGRSRAQGWELPHVHPASGRRWHQEPWARSSAGEGMEDETAGAEAQLSPSATGDVQHGAAQPSSASRGLRIRPPPACGSRSSSSAVTSNPSHQQLRGSKNSYKASGTERICPSPAAPLGPTGSTGSSVREPTTTHPTACTQRPAREPRSQEGTGRSCSCVQFCPRGRRPCTVPGLHLLRLRP